MSKSVRTKKILKKDLSINFVPLSQEYFCQCSNHKVDLHLGALRKAEHSFYSTISLVADRAALLSKLPPFIFMQTFRPCGFNVCLASDMRR